MSKAKVTATHWEVLTGDCIKLLAKQPDASVPLVFADPPFNIGRNYDNYDDQRPAQEYLAWCEQWLQEVYRVTHKHGTFWLAIGDKFVSELDVLAKELGFHKRAHVIWLYTFGVNCTKNFTKSHTHLLYFTRSKTQYTFNDSEPFLRIPSARQLLYNDKRANPQGRLPDDTWILLPQQLEPMSDTWLESRICGTFKERVPEVDNQMPLPIMSRIITATSKPNDLVLDPFTGSGTTGEAARLWGRRFLGMELSTKVAAKARLRITKRELEMFEPSKPKARRK